MRRLRQNPFLQHQQTQMPRSPPLPANARIDINRIHESLPPYRRHEPLLSVPIHLPFSLPLPIHLRRRLRLNLHQLPQTPSEPLSQPRRPVHKVFIHEHIQRGAGDGTSERIAAVGGPVLAWGDAGHDGVGGENGGDGVSAATEGLR